MLYSLNCLEVGVVVGVIMIQRLSGFSLLLEGAGLIHIEAT